MDAFYVTRHGEKLTSPRAVAELKTALTTALEEGEPASQAAACNGRARRWRGDAAWKKQLHKAQCDGLVLRGSASLRASG